MTTTTAPTINATVEVSYGSHEVLEHLRSMWITFDHVGAHFQRDNLALAANLRTMAEVCEQFAAHALAMFTQWQNEEAADGKFLR